MAKLVFLLCSFFVCTVFATSLFPTKLEKIKHQLENVRDGAINSIKTLNVDNVERRRAIVSHSSEFAHRIQEAVNRIFKTFVRVDERYSHQILPQVALRLNNITHEVQEVIITKPSMLRQTLQDNVSKVSDEVTKLLEVLTFFNEHNDEGSLGHDVRDIVDNLIDAIHQLHVRSHMYDQTHKINAEADQDLGNKIVDTLNKKIIYWLDPNTYELYKTTAHHFDHTLNRIFHHFENEILYFSEKERSKFEEIVRCLHDIRIQLNTVLYKTWTKNVDTIKTQLRLTVRNVNVQMQKLATIGDGLKDEHNIAMNNSIRNMAADFLQGERRLLWKLEEIKASTM